MRFWKRYGWVVALAVVVATGGLYWHLRDGTAQAAETTAQVVAVRRGSLTASISPTGEVEAVHRLDMGFDVDRVALVEVNVTAGQQVAEEARACLLMVGSVGQDHHSEEEAAEVGDGVLVVAGGQSAPLLDPAE